MYKIAILGCENSHATNFLELIDRGLYPEIEVMGVYSDSEKAVTRLNEKFGVKIMENYTDFVGQLDGVMITARHGDNHYKYAKPYMNDGIPMFIDKPITCYEDEAVAFMKEAKEKNLRFCGGSTCAALKETLELAAAAKDGSVGELLGGNVVAPLHSDSPYGGYYFYAQHLVEIMTTVFGEDVIEVLANRSESSVTLLARYASFNVTATYLEHVNHYSLSIYGKDAIRTEELTFSTDSFRHEMDDMMDLLNGKPMKKSYESFIKPVFIINAILRSIESGSWEKIQEPTI